MLEAVQLQVAGHLLPLKDLSREGSAWYLLVLLITNCGREALLDTGSPSRKPLSHPQPCKAPHAAASLSPELQPARMECNNGLRLLLQITMTRPFVWEASRMM